MHYPWHPAFGRDVEVLYREARGGEDVHVCLRPDGSGVVIPSWMFDRARCGAMVLAAGARPDLGAIREARAILDELRSDRPAIAPNTRSQESADENDEPREDERQIALPIHLYAPPVAIDPKTRAAIVMVLARLLLESAEASARVVEVSDEP